MPLRVALEVRQVRPPLKKTVEHLQVDPRRRPARPLLKVERARIQLADVLDQRVELKEMAASPVPVRLP